MERSLKNVHLITYGDRNYARSKWVLAQEAAQFGFSNIHTRGPETLPAEFVRAHAGFFERNGKGGGFWLWKPFIVNELLSLINEGDFLFYADAGCAINLNGKKRFIHWLDICDQQRCVAFQMHGLPERHWTKMSVARHMNCDTAHIMDSGQLVATVFGLKKCRFTVELVREWLDICALEWTIDDSIQEIENDPAFREHRHDQSVFSLLRKRENCYTIPDETYPPNGNWNDPFINTIPIWARRRKK